MTASARITGIGRAFPPSLSQEEMWHGYFREHFTVPGMAERVFANCGVRRRHAVVSPLDEDVSTWSTGRRMHRYSLEAPALGIEAVRAALDQAGLAAAEVGLLAVSSCTGYSTPGVDVRVAAELGMATDLQRLVIGHTGCHAAVPGIGSTSDYVVARGRPAVLLCVELTSLHLQPAGLGRDQVVAHALFSDAAVAVVLEQAPGLEVIDITAFTDTSTADHMTWDITDLGFTMGLSPKVPDVLALHVRPAVTDLLARNGIGLESVSGWAVHPGGPRILETVEAELDLAPDALDASRQVLAEHGNCSSATVLLVLDTLIRAGRSGYIVMLAFGPGLTVYAVLLRTATY